MNDLTKILIAFAFAVALTLPGCSESPNSSAGENHSADDGHNHANEEDDHEGHDHGQMRSLGIVEIAGTTLAVSISGDIQPSSEVHLELEVASGPIPAAVRFWIGDQAGIGTLKSKADAHDDHFHGQTEAPASLTGASLWIEVETASGERQTAPVSLD